MAFVTRSLRVLCRVYDGCSKATYSTLRQPISRISLVQETQRHRYSTVDTTSKSSITSSFTNFQSTIQTLGEEQQQKQEEEERARRAHQEKMFKLGYIAFAISTTIGGGIILHELGSPDYDENGKPIEDEFSHLPPLEQSFKRINKQIRFYTKFIQEPSREKLLPDPLKYPYIQPPYTLVLEIKDVLVHPDWTYQTGWRFKKRPGLDQFLEAVAPPQFEIVVYTAESGQNVFPILDALDPHGYIMYRLVRDATRFVDGHHVKDLNALNRDLSKVIVIDWNSESVKYHPENTLKIPRWTGTDDDTTMLDLAAFLQTIMASNVEDVRDVLNYYRQFENPLQVFRENQRKLLMEMEEKELKAQEESSKVLTSRWKPSFLRK